MPRATKENAVQTASVEQKNLAQSLTIKAVDMFAAELDDAVDAAYLRLAAALKTTQAGA